MGYTGTVYMHFGVITSKSTSPTDWQHSNTNWGTTSAPVAAPAGTNKWTITINNPRIYFGVPAGETIYKIVMLFRNAAGTLVQRNADGTDMYVPIYAAGTKGIQFTDPFIRPTYNFSRNNLHGSMGSPVTVKATASGAGGILNLYYNGNKISGPLTGATTISGSGTATTLGNQEFVAEFMDGANVYYDTVSYYLAPDNVMEDLPAGVQQGINYSADCSMATLVLYAPQKNHVVVVGDFPGSNWAPSADFQMKKTTDGNYYWLTLHNLVAGNEYAFNYQVDDTLFVADPYTEKVLDPYNDPYIPSSTYPNLKPYPVNHYVSPSRNGIMSVLQTCTTPYAWQVTNFTKPDKHNLITYELLVRDFGDARNYQMLIDTISYFKRLGVNAIELMPVNEFSGNDSWGYNPTYYCALDKAYGTKEKFKQFVDLCHQNGIAVILDVVYNQMEAGQAPQGRLYWDEARNRPAANNPWLNIVAPHPYFPYQYDLNHSTPETQYLVERSLDYWQTEYKVDGFRVDAGKGFTQKCTQVNELCPVSSGSIEDYDASRVANLERYYDFVQAHHPGSYMILEFLGQQRAEEQEYANHGFLLWGNNNTAYNQATMGYDNSNFSKIVYNSGEEAFSTPAEMGYMESHDEERLMFKNLAYGNASGSYHVKDLATATQRNAAAAALFFTVPGPKMFWQFGERGYDISIDSSGGRVSAKPPHWEYMQDPNRLQLFNAYSQLIHLRRSYPETFNSTNFTYDFYDNNGQFKRFQIADPNNAGLKVTVIANFDVVQQSRIVTFQAPGNWYNFLSNGTGNGFNGPTGSNFNLSSPAFTITLQPGEYHVYTNQQVVLPLKMLSFTGARTPAYILLDWTTANEKNVKNFTVQRSFNGREFATIGALAAKNSNTDRSVYQYSDKDATAVNASTPVYYRLKITDLDGQFSYSDIAIVKPVENTTIRFYPNPVTGGKAYLSLGAQNQSRVHITIRDIKGRTYKNYTTSTGSGLLTIDVSKLANGVYVLQAQSGNKSVVQQFIIHQ